MSGIKALFNNLQKKEIELESEINSRSRSIFKQKIKLYIKECEVDVNEHKSSLMTCISSDKFIYEDDLGRLYSYQPGCGLIRKHSLIPMMTDALRSQILHEAFEEEFSDDDHYRYMRMSFFNMEFIVFYTLRPKIMERIASKEIDTLISELRFQTLEDAIKRSEPYYKAYKRWNPRYQGTLRHFVLIEKISLYINMISNLDYISTLRMDENIYNIICTITDKYNRFKTLDTIFNTKYELSEEAINKIKETVVYFLEDVITRDDLRIELVERSYENLRYNVNMIPDPGVCPHTDFFYYKMPIPFEDAKKALIDITTPITDDEGIRETCYGPKYFSRRYRRHILHSYKKLNNTIKLDNLSLYLICLNLEEYCKIYKTNPFGNYDQTLLNNVRIGVKQKCVVYKNFLNELSPSRDTYVLNRFMDRYIDYILPLKYFTEKYVRPYDR